MNELAKQIASLDTLQVDGNTYLDSNAVTHLVAAFLFPNYAVPEPQNEREEILLIDTIKQVVLQAGFLPDEIYLGPGKVSWAQRGMYYQKAPDISPEKIEELIRRHVRVDGEWPCHVVPLDVLVADACYMLSGETASEEAKQAVETTISHYMEQTGWQPGEDDSFSLMRRPLEYDRQKGRQAARDMLHNAARHGYDVWKTDIWRAMHREGYGRVFRHMNPTDEMLADVRAILEEVAYTEGELKFMPKPIELPENATAICKEAIRQIPLITANAQRQYLPAKDVRKAVEQALGVAGLSDHRWLEVAHGPLAKALAALRFADETITINRPDNHQEYVAVYERLATGVRPENLYRIQFADGLGAYAPVVVLDEDEQTIVALQMLGTAEAVNANWAKLVNGGSVVYILGTDIKLGGMKNHVKLQTSLPCGWKELWLIHRQTSLKSIDRGSPFFYVLDGDTHSPPETFFTMLDMMLSIPTLPTWADYLWTTGYQANLIRPIENSKSVGMGAWKVIAEIPAWAEIISSGLSQKSISFPS